MRRCRRPRRRRWPRRPRALAPLCHARTPHPRAVTLPAASAASGQRAVLYRIERSILDLLDLLQWRTLPLFRRKTLPLPAVSPPPNVTHDRFAEVKPSVTAGQTPLAPPPINQPNPSCAPAKAKPRYPWLSTVKSGARFSWPDLGTLCGLSSPYCD